MLTPPHTVGTRSGRLEAGDLASDITIRTLTGAARPFATQEVHRLMPRDNRTDWDPGANWFRRLVVGELDDERPAGHETFVAVGPDDEPLGLVSVQPERELFSHQSEATRLRVVP